jgi:hypothetical protein
LHERHVERERVRDELVGPPSPEHDSHTHDKPLGFVFVPVIPRPHSTPRSHLRRVLAFSFRHHQKVNLVFS